MKVYEPEKIDRRVHEERRLIRHKGLEVWVIRQLDEYDTVTEEPKIKVFGAHLSPLAALDLIAALDKAVELATEV